MSSMSARQIRGENGQDGTLLEWAARFSTEEACERFLFEEAHPHGWACPRCGNRRCTRCRPGATSSSAPAAAARSP